MQKTKSNFLFSICYFFLIVLPFSVAFANDDDHHEEKKWYKKIFNDDDEHDKHESEYLKPVNNET